MSEARNEAPPLGGDATLDVASALAAARRRGVDRLDAQVMLGQLLQRPRSWLLAHDEEVLRPELAQQWQAWLERRAEGEPLAYLLGEKEFHGLSLSVSPDVLVPRPDTEVLVDWALERLGQRAALARALPAPPRVLDLGTGSGAIALSIKHRQPAARVSASDVSERALSVARSNAQRLGLEISWHAGNWWDAVPPGRFDLVLSNPPYIAGDDAHLAALRHEPRLALTPEGDGLAALRAIVRGAPAFLAGGAWLLLEHGHDQAHAVAGLLEEAGFQSIATRIDLGGNERCTGGYWQPGESVA